MKKKVKYKPHPLDVSDVVLPEEVEQLVELLARNVHEVWAQSRYDQEWSWGPERSDVLKTHPCLVPYDKLTEVEKQYDRDTAVGTLKFILKKGFKITK